jgi:hypothetical protein
LPAQRLVSGWLRNPILSCVRIVQIACGFRCSPSRWTRHSSWGGTSQTLIACSLARLLACSRARAVGGPRPVEQQTPAHRHGGWHGSREATTGLAPGPARTVGTGANDLVLEKTEDSPPLLSTRFLSRAAGRRRVQSRTRTAANHRPVVGASSRAGSDNVGAVPRPSPLVFPALLLVPWVGQGLVRPGRGGQ